MFLLDLGKLSNLHTVPSFRISSERCLEVFLNKGPAPGRYLLTGDTPDKHPLAKGTPNRTGPQPQEFVKRVGLTRIAGPT